MVGMGDFGAAEAAMSQSQLISSCFNGLLTNS